MPVAAAMIEARTQLAVKVETAEGVAESLTGTEAVLVANAKFTPSIAMGERNNMSSSLSPWASIPGARSAKMEFDMELKGSGTAGTAPKLGTLLLGCGIGETVSAGVSVAYKPASTAMTSLTMAMYVDGVIKKMWGAKGNVSLKLEDGAPGWLHFEFTGADFSVTDGAMLSTNVSYESTKPAPFLSATMTIGAYSALVGLMEINMNNTVALRKSVNAASGYFSAAITNRKPTMTMDPEAVIVATHDFYGLLRSGTEAALSLVLTGSAGNICTITAPKVQYTVLSDDAKEGIKNYGMTCQLNRNAGDDELSIVFT